MPAFACDQLHFIQFLFVPHAFDEQAKQGVGMLPPFIAQRALVFIRVLLFVDAEHDGKAVQDSS